MSELFEKRAAERAVQAARDAITSIRRKNYVTAQELLQEALADVKKAAAQARARP